MRIELKLLLFLTPAVLLFCSVAGLLFADDAVDVQDVYKPESSVAGSVQRVRVLLQGPSCAWRQRHMQVVFQSFMNISSNYFSET